MRMSTEPNDLLRSAREATPSTRFPGRAMTRTELAERMVDHVWRHYGIDAPVDRKYVAKLESGRIRFPAARYRHALRDILGAGTDDELGFVSANHRRAAPPLARPAGRDVAGRGTGAGDRTDELLAAIRDRRARLRRIARGDMVTVGSAHVARTVARDLLADLAHLCRWAGELAGEAGRADESGRYLTAGVRAAHVAGDDQLAGELLALSCVGRASWARASGHDPSSDACLAYARAADRLARAELRAGETDDLVQWAMRLLGDAVVCLEHQSAPPQVLLGSFIA
jgi:hypothetical protein